jgi:hypothetical protein
MTKNLFSIFLVSLFSLAADAQPYLSATMHDETYLLSESLLLNQSYLPNPDLQLKTLFVWDNDRVYRLVCFETREATAETVAGKSAGSLRSLLNLAFETPESVAGYGTDFAQAVNQFSQKEILNASTTSHGTQLILNERVLKNDAFLPIRLKDPVTGMVHYLSPFYINYYRVEKEIDAQITQYSLQATLYIDGVATRHPKVQITPQYELYDLLHATTLNKLITFKKENLIHERDVTKHFATFELARQQYYTVDSSGVVLKPRLGNSPFLQPNTKENTCRSPRTCRLDYAYDCYCYNPTSTKALRIFNHCPFTIGTENYSYVKYMNNYILLKAQHISYAYAAGESAEVWQLEIPSIGYWMNNVRQDAEGFYFAPDVTSHNFTINNLSIADFNNY